MKVQYTVNATARFEGKHITLTQGKQADIPEELAADLIQAGYATPLDPDPAKKAGGKE